MSEYSAFFAQDFASRCHDLLRHFYEPAKASDREVTLLLAVAAAGLVVPLERLFQSKGQPPLDRFVRRHESAQLEAQLAEHVAVSALFDDSADQWHGGLLGSAEGTPDEWNEMRSEKLLPGATKVVDLVCWLRHGLAHGNITTRVGANRTITRLVFVCGYKNSEKQPLRYVSVAPDDFHAFLIRWFACLAKLRVSREMLAELLDAREAACSRTTA